MNYSVLTYIFGDYECVHEVEQKDPNADYILVTDRRDLRSDTWRVVFDQMAGMNAIEKTYDVRYHPFRYADTDYVIRMDGSIGIRHPLGMFIDKMKRDGYDRCLMLHPRRNTMESEYEQWVRTRNYPAEQARRCMEFMRHLGYPDDYRGIFQACFEVVRRCRVNHDVNDVTYALSRYLAWDGGIERLDQTILSFVVNHLFSGRLKVLPVTQDIITASHLMQWYRHGTDNPILERQRIVPVMFDRQCTVWQPLCP